MPSSKNENDDDVKTTTSDSAAEERSAGSNALDAAAASLPAMMQPAPSIEEAPAGAGDPDEVERPMPRPKSPPKKRGKEKGKKDAVSEAEQEMQEAQRPAREPLTIEIHTRPSKGGRPAPGASRQKAQPIPANLIGSAWVKALQNRVQELEGRLNELGAGADTEADNEASTDVLDEQGKAMVRQNVQLALGPCLTSADLDADGKLHNVQHSYPRALRQTRILDVMPPAVVQLPRRLKVVSSGLELDLHNVQGAVCVLGQTGSGKSYLMDHGLVAAAEASGLTVTRITYGETPNLSTPWPNGGYIHAYTLESLVTLLIGRLANPCAADRRPRHMLLIDGLRPVLYSKNGAGATIKGGVEGSLFVQLEGLATAAAASDTIVVVSLNPMFEGDAEAESAFEGMSLKLAASLSTVALRRTAGGATSISASMRGPTIMRAGFAGAGSIIWADTRPLGLFDEEDDVFQDSTAVDLLSESGDHGDVSRPASIPTPLGFEVDYPASVGFSAGAFERLFKPNNNLKS